MPTPPTNTYSSTLAIYVQPALNSILAALPAGPTLDDLVTASYNYFQTTFYPSGGGTVPPQTTIELQSIINQSISGYTSLSVLSGRSGYSPTVMNYAQMLIGNSATSNIPTGGMSTLLASVESPIAASGMPVSEATPLLVTISIGNALNTYWNTVLSGSTSGWLPFINAVSNGGLNLPYWDVAGMDASLWGYANGAGLIQPSVDYVTNRLFAALASAVTVSAASVLFNGTFQRQPVSPITLNAQTIANLGGTGGHGTIGAPYFTVAGGNCVGSLAGECFTRNRFTCPDCAFTVAQPGCPIIAQQAQTTIIGMPITTTTYTTCGATISFEPWAQSPQRIYCC